MTTIDPHVTGAGTAAGTGVRADGLLTSMADWVTTSDHKKIGRLFGAASLLVLIAVAAIGAVLGVERIDAAADAFDTDALPQLFSLYRVLLTFGVVVPFGLGVSIAVVPLQLGARALAFPRLAAAGLFTWLIGTGLVIGSTIANGGFGGGDETMVDLFLASLALMVIGLVAAAGAVAASALTTRAPGMNMRRVPLFAWSALVGSLGLILALPVLVGTLALLFIDHRYSRTTFGGNVGIGSWVSYSFTQPATLLYAAPAFGLALETMATATRRRFRLRGVGLIGLGLVGTASFAAIAQVDVSLPGNVVDSSVGNFLADVIPFAVLHLLPLLGVVVVLGVATLAVLGRPRISSPVVLSLLGAEMVLVGALGNVVVNVGDAQLIGTVFEEGAWLFVSYGTVLALLGAVAYWGPKLWGRSMADKAVMPLALLGLLATVLAAGPYYVAGFAKQPAGSTLFDYSGPQELWNTLSAVGHGLMVLTVLAFVGLALRSFTSGAEAGDDPWDGQTLEWATTSPAPANNFTDVLAIVSAEPLLDSKPTSANTPGAKRGAA